jgi:hypothetical protein
MTQSEPPGETALRRLQDYRCRQRGTYCTPRIDAGRGIGSAGSWSQSCAERWSSQLAKAFSRQQLALDGAQPRWNRDVTDRAPTRAELEVRRVYEPSRLAAMYVSAAYAQVVPPQQRLTRSAWASASARVSRVVAVRPETGATGVRRAG